MAAEVQRVVDGRDEKGRFLPGNPSAFQRGRSGNPHGSSRRMRERRLLRDFLQEKLSDSVPPHLEQQLAEKGRALTYGEAIAARMVLEALTGDSRVSMARVAQVLRTEPANHHVAAELEVPDFTILADRLERRAEEADVD